MKLDWKKIWKKIWKEFDKWYEKAEASDIFINYRDVPFKNQKCAIRRIIQKEYNKPDVLIVDIHLQIVKACKI